MSFSVFTITWQLILWVGETELGLTKLLQTGVHTVNPSVSMTTELQVIPRPCLFLTCAMKMEDGSVLSSQLSDRCCHSLLHQLLLLLTNNNFILQLFPSCVLHLVSLCIPCSRPRPSVKKEKSDCPQKHQKSRLHLLVLSEEQTPPPAGTVSCKKKKFRQTNQLHRLTFKL